MSIEESIQEIAKALSSSSCLEIVKSIVGILASIATVATAVVAAKSARLSRKAADISEKSVNLQKEQIITQNQQGLFELRAKNYSYLFQCKNNFKKIENRIKFDDENQLFAEGLSDPSGSFVLPILLVLIGREFDEERLVDSSVMLRRDFSDYVKESVQKIQYTVSEIPLLFSKEVGTMFSVFLTNYRDLIVFLYSYGLSEVKDHSRKNRRKQLEWYGKRELLTKLSKELSANCKTIDKNKLFQKMEKEMRTRLEKQIKS